MHFRNAVYKGVGVVKTHSWFCSETGESPIRFCLSLPGIFWFCLCIADQGSLLKSSAMERWFHQPSIRSFHHDSRCKLPGFPRRQGAHSASRWIDRFHHGVTRATPQTNQLRKQFSVIGPAAQHPVQPHR